MTGNNQEASGGGWLRNRRLSDAAPDFHFVRVFAGDLFIRSTRSDEPNLGVVRVENIGGLYGICGSFFATN